MAKRLLLLYLLISVSVNAQKSYIVYYNEQNTSGKHLSLNSSETEKLIVDVNEHEVDEFLADMDQDNRVLFVEENVMMHITWEPGELDADNEDTYYYEQWALKDEYNGIRMPEAWDQSQGEDIVVAVLDTGILPTIDDFYHVLDGADLITRTSIANDGDGRDLDPSDPGDWHTPNEFPTCGRRYVNSSWHGSHVAGIIGAKGNNAKGIIGVAPKVSILPVRVLGKCGGELADIADGIRWAVGGKVDGLPINPNPANVINMSLGAAGECSYTIQQAINFAKSKGAVVVVSSGNSDYNLDQRPFNPASCFGIINTGASDQWASRSHYSNYGEQIDVMAPGGSGRYGKGVISFSNNGRTTPNVNTVEEKSGTSMAAPHVSGVAALILSLNPGLYPDQVEQILKDSSDPIVGKGTGSGLINVPEALRIAGETTPDPSFKSIEKDAAPNTYQPYTSFLNRTGDEAGGGSCGTIDLNNDGGGPGPGGKNGFFLTILMGLVMSRFFKKYSL